MSLTILDRFLIEKYLGIPEIVTLGWLKIFLLFKNALNALRHSLFSHMLHFLSSPRGATLAPTGTFIWRPLAIQITNNLVEGMFLKVFVLASVL